MRDPSEPRIKFNPGAVAMLACPACHGDLQADGDRLACGVCGRRYPVVDGIPSLIAERADPGSAI
jgi:uncharacterized protein YbaR (Trm112 family)